MTDVLRDVADTASRERVRLESGSVIQRVLLRLRFVGSEDAARNGLRYQPVVWTVIALVAVAFFWPGRHDAPATPAAISTPFKPVVVAPTTTVTTPSIAATPTTVPLPSATFAPPSSPSFSPPTTAFTPPVTGPPTQASSGPLAVREFGWSSTLSGVPNNGVPDGTMPVGNRLGNADKVSFARLSGGGALLTLEEDTTGAREALGSGLVVACRITDDGWAAGADQAMADAPTWDANTCVAGTEQDDAWVFDLSGFNDTTGQAGFALVPAPTAPADFQVTFKAS
jgi:hypothetical protein